MSTTLRIVGRLPAATSYVSRFVLTSFLLLIVAHLRLDRHDCRQREDGHQRQQEKRVRAHHEREVLAALRVLRSCRRMCALLPKSGEQGDEKCQDIRERRGRKERCWLNRSLKSDCNSRRHFLRLEVMVSHPIAVGASGHAATERLDRPAACGTRELHANLLLVLLPLVLLCSPSFAGPSPPALRVRRGEIALTIPHEKPASIHRRTAHRSGVRRRSIGHEGRWSCGSASCAGPQVDNACGREISRSKNHFSYHTSFKGLKRVKAYLTDFKFNC